MSPPAFPADQARALLALGLSEDAPLGDATTIALGDFAEKEAEAAFTAKYSGVIAGLPLLELAAELARDRIVTELLVAEGSAVKDPPVALARWQGPAREILTLERLALNLLQYLSGIASHTAACVAALHAARPDTRVKILDTRKTLPAYRHLAKYAVALGGGSNHRMSLSDAIMIKDNHVAMAGSVEQAMTRVAKNNPESLKVIVEVDRPEQVRPAIAAGARWLLLDNMTNEELVQCRELAGDGITLEVSGGVTLKRLPSLGELPVDYVSMGALTHSVMAADISLDFSLSR